MSLAGLLTLPEGVAAADTMIGKLDQCLAHGVARLGPEQQDGLRSVVASLTGTPLHGVVGDAVEAMLSAGAQVTHLQALAAARVALHGARYDALASQAYEVLGYTAMTYPDEQAPETPSETVATLMESVRQWLLEVAFAGTMQLEASTVAPFAAVLDELQQHPSLFRLSALLTGFVYELLDHVPTAALDDVPTRRWADLWTRALLHATYLPSAAPGSTYQGAFKPLGVDMRLNDRMASAVVHGLIDGDSPRLARATVSTWKVDAVHGAEVWTLFKAQAGTLFDALAAGKTLTLNDMTLGAAGDLYWRDDLASPGGPHAALDVAKKNLRSKGTVQTFRPHPLDRHPATLAIPVCVTDARVKGKGTTATLTVDDVTLPLALARLSPQMHDLSAIKKASEMVGLLRFDAGQWWIQPITLDAKDGVVPGYAKAIKAKSTNAATLQERASKLLRAKA